ncbi:MAG TPA: RNA polymerase sigma factor [Candidatus Acidoferrum sp.]|nr:RNA polymerase sigma factor [Candidatus Acidoferrum sp.]
MVLTTPAARAEIEALYRQHGPALLLFATAIAGERSRAQDMVHQVFLKLIEDGSLQQVSNKKAYVFTCVRNALANESRRRQRTVSLDPDAAWFTAPDQNLAAETNLRRALGSLPREQSQIVVLHVWAELTFSEIGEVLGISPNTAGSRYRYALAKLRDALGGSVDTTQVAKKENSCARSR